MANETPRPAGRPPIRRVGIVAKARLAEAAPLLDELAVWLAARDVAAVFERDTARLLRAAPAPPQCSRDELPGRVDLVVVLGGDGTLLAMADRIASAGAEIPILGVNFGSLGFLTEVTLPELFPSLESVLAGTACIDARLMLRARIGPDPAGVPDLMVLNDVVVTRGALSRIIELRVWVDDDFVASFKADGLILATPTGSTAYNLAAGGPIVHPTVDAVVLTPIAPHTLTNRPVVIPGTATVRVQPHVDGPPDAVYVTFDGQTGFPLPPASSVTVRRAEAPLRLVRAATRSYFEILRQKLKWAER
jgi:NAD+ kinase